MTCWQSLFETVGISQHLRELPSGNSSSYWDLLPAFDPRALLVVIKLDRQNMHKNFTFENAIFSSLDSFLSPILFVASKGRYFDSARDRSRS